jgi:hypothetical protein
MSYNIIREGASNKDAGIVPVMAFISNTLRDGKNNKEMMRK